MSPRHQGRFALILQGFAGDTITETRVSPGVTRRAAGGVEGVTGLAQRARPGGARLVPGQFGRIFRTRLQENREALHITIRMEWENCVRIVRGAGGDGPPSLAAWCEPGGWARVG